jgi:hypothetical protein
MWKAIKKAKEEEFKTIFVGNDKVQMVCLRYVQRAIHN